MIFLFLLIILSSALFRVTNLDLIEFKADEAINFFLASRPLFGHPFPPGGTVSSIGILNPPLFNYLLFPFVLISTDPRIVSFFIGLINSLAIGLLFLLVKRYYGLSIALITSLLFAFSPWAILFSRKIWAQDIIVPFFILLLIALHKIIIDKKTLYWILYVVSSLFLLQIHQSTIFFLLLLTIFLLLGKPKIQYKFVLIGFVLGIIPLLPYIVFQLTSGCFDCGQFLTARERLAPQFNYSIFFRPFQIMNQGNFHSILGGDTFTFAQRFPTIYSFRLLFYGEYLLLPIGIFLFWKRFPNLRFLVYSVFLLPLVYFLFRIDPQMHYFVIITPLLFIFLGTAIWSFMEFKNMLFKFFSLSIVVALITISLLYNVAFFNILNDLKSLQGDYGTTFIKSEEAAGRIFDRYKTDPRYKEMIIASYVPKHLVHGDIGIARMLYKSEVTKNYLSQLEARLKEVPEDARVYNELISFYTNVTPTLDTVRTLRVKNFSIAGYSIVYDEVYKLYLERNLKKAYAHGDFGVRFEYPQHWVVEDQPKNEVIVKTDDYRLVIASSSSLFGASPETTSLQNKTYKPTTASILDETLNGKECVTKENRWCGTSFETLQIGKHRYLIFYRFEPAKAVEPPDINSKNFREEVENMNKIVGSLREY